VQRRQNTQGDTAPRPPAGIRPSASTGQSGWGGWR
jgi:hypothetical protein